MRKNIKINSSLKTRMNNILFVSIAFLVCLGIIIVYKLFISREGFQSSPSSSNPKDSIKCNMMKMIQETMEKNLEKAIKTNNETAIKFGTSALDSVKIEISNAGCV